ncbi:uncharacterized protein LOC125956699 isoform X1 [Anopheles darlingi]|uniref:uncharacterized protein LOC125956699 isoform X1 n=1 Tax=Anopheles darlingi TaxID=43151 RepID=UPI0020FFFE22|nr:uncharacterized protein LOC125956699 isoform X1 [Anopheles darlingi]XP_049544754.1 uncharacterized protein LOC125956699 isoform X1 [Anopheles darlingi]
MMIQQASRVAHQANKKQLQRPVSCSTSYTTQTQKGTATCSASDRDCDNRATTSVTGGKPHQQLQFTKFRSNRSASSSRVTSKIVEPKVDCRRKSAFTAASHCFVDRDGHEEEGTINTERIPKMELLKLNYVKLKNEQAKRSIENKNASAVEKKQKKTSTASTVVSASVVDDSSTRNVNQVVGRRSLSACAQDPASALEGLIDNNDQTNSGDQEEVVKSKYLVYKKHNGFGANVSGRADAAVAKLQYINDSDIKMKASVKKKYGLFENKKKNKLETVQYYFDSRSYERYVDNKLYGVVNKTEQKEVPSSLPPVSNACNSPKKQAFADHQSPQTNNRPSMMRVIKQPAATNRTGNASRSKIAIKKNLSVEAPAELGALAGLKQENCRVFKLQKSHTSTNLLMRHRSMNDIHRINQLFLDPNASTPDSEMASDISLLPQRQTSCSKISPKIPNSRVLCTAYSKAMETTGIEKSKIREPSVHRFEKHRKSDEPSAKQQKYLVHKRLSARYKTNDNLAKIIAHPVAAEQFSAEDTIRKRIRQIIDSQDQLGSTETIDLTQDHVARLFRQHHKDDINSIASTHAKEIAKFRFQRSKSATRLIGLDTDRKERDDEVSSDVSVRSSKTTCGYKNCKYSNCPMSSSSSASSTISTTNSFSDRNNDKLNTCEETVGIGINHISNQSRHSLIDYRKETSEIIASGKRTSIVINDDELPSNEATKDVLINNVLNEKMTNTNREKQNNDVHILFSKMNESVLDCNRIIIEKCIESTQGHNGAETVGNFGTAQKFWSQQNQRNIKLKNNPQTKAYDDKININNKIRNEENNSIRIFISSNNQMSTSSTSEQSMSLISNANHDTHSNRSSTCSSASTTSSSCGSTSGDSDKDDGYCDHSERSISPTKQPSSIVSTLSSESSNSGTICSESTNISSITCTGSSGGLHDDSSPWGKNIQKANRFTSKTNIRLGRDGALFLNNGCFTDESDQSVSHAANNDAGVRSVCCSNGEENSGRCCKKRNSVVFGGSTCSKPCLVSSINIDDNVVECENEGLISVIANSVNREEFIFKKSDINCECSRSMKNIPNKIESFSTRPISIEGPPDSGISISSDTIIANSDSDLNLQSQTDSDERKLKRGHVLAELLETERIYVAEMGSILKGYRDEMLSEEMSCMVPPGLQGKSDILFGNLHELYTFHNEIFLKDLENCISTTELVALCFVQRRDTFFRLYSYYCQNIPRSERLRETLVDTHLFLQECQKKLGHKLPLAAYLLKPVQRITKYQLLLKDLLKFSDTGTCSRELQKALDCMLVVLKCVNDSMHQIAITGFPADLSQQGELLLQDSFQIWTESKKDIRLRLKTQNRHIFLYQKAMLFCKQGSKTGHNKSTYQFKHWLQMSQIGLTESVRGDSRRFEVWLQGRQEVHTIQAGTIEIKNKWVTEIKRVLLNQLEELKGEKIKQYGLNHKSLRHTASWDIPPTIHNASSHVLSGDQQANASGIVTLSQDVVSRIPHMNEEGIMNATGISSSSSEHDNQEANAWSSDYSNSEDEFTTVEDSVTPGHKFVSLADYCAIGNSEVTMKESDVVELLKVGCAGWWFVKVIATGLEGWAPAAYLEPSNRKHSRLRSARSQDKLNVN